MKTSNKALALEWTLACPGLKLCPPFNTRSSEGTIGTLDTALTRRRRSTIHCGKKGALCWRSHLKEIWQDSFQNSAWQAASSQSLTLQTVLSHDNRTKGETESRCLQRDMDPISLGLAVSVVTTLSHIFALRQLRMKLNRTLCVKEAWRIRGALRQKVNTEQDLKRSTLLWARYY